VLKYQNGGLFMRIGNLEFDNNIFLAPMAGISDYTYRNICKKMGCGLVYTEMISAKGLYYNDAKTKNLLKTSSQERPVAVQIFGSEPDVIAKVVYNLNNSDFEIIDINMGCPTLKITKNGDGSALMRKPELVWEIIKKAVSNSEKPVTVKIRKGWNDDNINAVEIAKIAEEAGVSAIAVHGRTREEFYTGKADWNIIRDVKSNLTIPVIGNGDIFTHLDAKEILDYTKCDAIMIGRGVQGNPWLIKEIYDYLYLGIEPQIVTVDEKIEMIKEHMEGLIEEFGLESGVRQMRKHIAWYIKGLKNSSKIKDLIFRTTNKDEINTLLNGIKEYSN
jgi:nifR3 family TIM-barrel protein